MKNNHKKTINNKKTAIIIMIIAFVMIISGYVVLTLNSKTSYIEASKQYEEFNDNEKFITSRTLNNIKNDIYNISMMSIYRKNRVKITEKTTDAEEYYKLKKETKVYYDLNNIVKSNTTSKDVKKLISKQKKLEKKYQKKIDKTIKEIETNVNNIDAIKTGIRNLYNEDNTLKEEITIDNLNDLKYQLLNIPQTDLVYKYLPEIENNINVIKEREKAYQDQVKNSWVILKVPYISQNHNNVLNGCEAASLLMALQYKGQLLNMTLPEYATLMPKSTDPYQGFTYDVFGLEPKNVPHWIAPPPLAKFGRDSSGYQNVIDGTGYSLDQLDQEIVNGNPVVIYATGKFKDLKEFKEQAPVNIHVQLLAGYNTMTKEQLIIDPWTYNDGKNSWTIPYERLKELYDGVGKRSVIVR